jgi:integrase
MAHIRKVYDKDGNIRAYKARWLDPSGTERSKTFTKQRAALDHMHKMESTKNDGAYIDMSNKVTVTQAAERWVAMQPHRVTTAQGYRSTIKNHLADTNLGKMRLVQVRTSDVQAWVKERSLLMGPQSVRIYLGRLLAVFNAAVKDGVIASNPAQHVNLPKRENEDFVPLTVQQVRALADAMPDRFQALVVAQAGLGLRVSELLALRTQDVNFLKREVRIDAQLVSHNARTSTAASEFRQPLKNDKPRTVPLPQVVAVALGQHIAKYPPLEDGTLFYSKRSRTPLWQSAYGPAFRRAVERAGLPEGTSSHDLRHHFASELLSRGASVIEVAKWLGDTVGVTLRVYGHVMQGGEDRMRRLIEEAWSEAV